MKRLKRLLSACTRALRQMVVSHPVATALCVVLWGAANLIAEEAIGERHATLLLVIAAGMAVAGALWRRSSPRKLLFTAALLLPMAALTMHDGLSWMATRHYTLSWLAVVPLALLLARGMTSNRRFVGDALAYLRAATIGGLLAATALVAALALFLSVAYIFEIWQEAADTVVRYLATFAALVIWPLSSLATLDRNDSSPELPPSPTRDLLLHRILTPALLLYTTILYLYALKIVMTWSLPKGGVAWLVSGFMVTLFAVRALQEFVAERRYRWFYDHVGLVALPPLTLFWVGIDQRIADYGLTEWRFYLLLCGVMMTAAAGLFLRQRTARFAPLAALALLLSAATIYIPGLSAEAFAIRSQSRRALRLAALIGVPQNATGGIDLTRIPPIPLSDTIRQTASRGLHASLDFLESRNALTTDRFGITRIAEIADRLPEAMPDKDDLQGTDYYFLHEACEPIDIEGFRRSYDTTIPGIADWSTKNDTLRITIDGRTLLERPIASLLRDRSAQLGMSPDDDALYTADRLLQFRSDSLLVIFSHVAVDRHKGRYTELHPVRFYTK